MMRKLISVVAVVSLLMSLFVVTAGATQSCKENFSKNYTLTGDQAYDILSIAEAQIGKSTSNLGYTEGWCADFVSDCARLAGVSTSVIPHTGLVSNMYNAMVNSGAQKVSTPQRGDVIFYNSSGWCHVALVLNASQSVHGNLSGSVMKINHGSYRDVNGNAASYTILRPNYAVNTVHTFYFNANGGSGTMASSQVKHGADFTLPKNTFTRAGYIFKGWNAKRSDGKWYCPTIGWKTDSEINANGYTKSLYTDSWSGNLSTSWTNGMTGAITVTMYAVWEKEEYRTPLTAQPLPSIVEAKENDAASVTVVETGDDVKLKWYYKNKGDSKFTYTPSFTGTTYSVVMTPARDGRQVYCVLSDKYGNSVKTNTVTLKMIEDRTPLTVQQLPVVVEAPKNKEASVTVVETGDDVTLKWYYKNAGDDEFTYTPSFTGTTYSVVMTAARDGRQVYCVLSDKYGNEVRTNTVTLKMEVRTPLTAQPLPKAVAVKNGKTAKVTVKETGDDVTLEWYYKDKGSSSFKLASSFTGTTYSIVMTDARAGRQVYCVLRDMYGNSIKTNTVTFDKTVSIKSLTKANVKAVGKTAKVTVNASGTGLKYTWYYKNKGAAKFVKTSSFKGKTYSLEMKDSNAGRQVYCVVTDKYGNSVKSAVVTLDTTVRIKTQPKSAKAAIGKSVRVSVKAVGSGLTYKWYYKDKGDSKYKLASRKSRTYSVVMSKARAGRQVYCVITDKYGNSVKTKVVTLSKK